MPIVLRLVIGTVCRKACEASAMHLQRTFLLSLRQQLDSACCSAIIGKHLLLLVLMLSHFQMKSRQPGQISALIVSPTRELASQIAVEAEALGWFHNITVQVRQETHCAFLR